MPDKSYSFERHIDYSLLLPVFFLVLIGFYAIFVATSHDHPDRLTWVMAQQGIWVLIGVISSLVVMLFNKRFLWLMTPALYLLGLGLMVLPLIYFSPDLVAATGAKNWVTIGGTTLFQPSEFMKIAYILALSALTVWYQEAFANSNWKRDLGLIGLYGALTAPVMVLLALQRDLGTALVFLAILVGIIWLSGIGWRLILPVLVTLVLGLGGFLLVFSLPDGPEWLHGLGIDAYQINRISAWLDPFAYADGISYQQTQSMIAIGTGGLAGKGVNELDLAIPVRESDMIFTVIAENFGFIGSSLVLILYLWLIYRMLQVTLVSNNRFYTYISTGFTMMILFHIFENIGASLGILPLTGIPLPFISQGGSSLVSNMIGVGLVMSMSFQKSIAAVEEL